MYLLNEDPAYWDKETECEADAEIDLTPYLDSSETMDPYKVPIRIKGVVTSNRYFPERNGYEVVDIDVCTADPELNKALDIVFAKMQLRHSHEIYVWGKENFK